MANAMQNGKRLGAGEGKAWAVAILASAALNLLFFGLMPGLVSRLPQEQPSRAISDPVRLTQVRRPPEPKKELPSPPREARRAAPTPGRARPQAETREAPRSDIEPLPLELNPALPPMSVALPAPDFKALPLPEAKAVETASSGQELQGVFNESDLDSGVTELSAAKPGYPLRARRMRVEGAVKVRFLLTRTGEIRDIVIVEADPEGYFEEAALRAVGSSWRFSPGRKNGEPVDAVLVRTIRFKIGE